MLLERVRFTLDGLECNKIGVSYEAFNGQPGFCSSPLWSCLHNQLWNFWDVSKLIPVYLFIIKQKFRTFLINTVCDEESLYLYYICYCFLFILKPELVKQSSPAQYISHFLPKAYDDRILKLQSLVASLFLNLLQLQLRLGITVEQADQNRISRKQVPLYCVEGKFERINQHPVMFQLSKINTYMCLCVCVLQNRPIFTIFSFLDFS